MLLLNLAPHWVALPQYHYGWLVAGLGLLLFYRRAHFCPPVSSINRPLGLAGLVLFGALVLPVWVIAQATPDWRLVSWLLAVTVIAVWLSGIYLLGGRSWLGHFCFSVCFILTAVPWPGVLELAVTQGLSQLVATVSVELLNAVNTPALIRGNVIEVGTGVLGMDAACSGVRSLQATLMLALFFGELYSFRWTVRVLLPVIGVLLAVGCNIMRATFLAAVVARSGVDAVARYHDPAGVAIFVICLLLLWWIARQFSQEDSRSGTTTKIAGFERLQPRGAWLGVWLVVVIVATELWYRSAPQLVENQWSISWPEQSAGFRELEIPAMAQELLCYDVGSGGSWREPDGAHWVIYLFRWNAGPVRARILARMHRPEICLPAGGYQLERDDGQRVFTFGAQQVAFRKLIFSRAGQQIFVFYVISDDAVDGLPSTSIRRASLQAALSRQRNLGQNVLQVIVESSADPEAEVAKRLAEILTVGGDPAVDGL